MKQKPHYESPSLIGGIVLSQALLAGSTEATQSFTFNNPFGEEVEF